jgi:hypothetical protein
MLPGCIKRGVLGLKRVGVLCLWYAREGSGSTVSVWSNAASDVALLTLV